MLDIPALILEIVKDILIGIGLLVIGLVVVPEEIVAWTIRAIRPSLFSSLHQKWEKLVKHLTSLFILHDAIDFDDDPVIRRQFDRIKDIEQYASKIEKNLYFVDLSVDLLRTLDFACPASVGSMNNELVSQSMYYLQHYLRKIEYDKQDPAFNTNIMVTLQRIETNYTELANIKREDKDAESFKAVEAHVFRQAIQQFEDYRKGLENRLRLNRNEQRNIIREITDEIKAHPKKIADDSERDRENGNSK